jgi:hypoxanthine phosphoribosyltransferase
MNDKIYRQQVSLQSAEIDLDFWSNPEGVQVPDDELRFLLVPDVVEYAAIIDVARQVHEHQSTHRDSPGQISCALMITMGGLLPGVMLHDHLVKGRAPGSPKIEFGTVGVSLYKSPGQRYDQPRIQQEISIPVEDRTVLLVDDLSDLGGTIQFLDAHVRDAGATRVLKLVLYLKPAAKALCGVDFYFGETPQDTWVITPRERVETLVKRVPIWRERGASEQECRRRLVDIIGYPPRLVDQYLPGLLAALP